MAETQIFEPEGRAIPYVDEGRGPAFVLRPERGHDVGYLAPLVSGLVADDFPATHVGATSWAIEDYLDWD